MEGLCDLVSLTKLYVIDCSDLLQLHDMDDFCSLRFLKIDQCRQLRSLPWSGLLVSLETFILFGCHQALEEQFQRKEDGARPTPHHRRPRAGAGTRMAMPPEVCTRFHLISLSEGFDLSPLFENDPAALPGRATARAGGTRVLLVVVLVDVKKDGGDAMEYQSFCSEELRPALKDIVWSLAAT
uniref:NAF domain-containing protein n=1 Tax=Oryza nivara TaxID=4536 RepID=A0A0E0HTL5_ORYNI